VTNMEDYTLFKDATAKSKPGKLFQSRLFGKQKLKQHLEVADIYDMQKMNIPVARVYNVQKYSGRSVLPLDYLHHSMHDRH
jgi:hypothetical protein